MLDFGEAEKHLEVESFKLKEAKDSLILLETEIIKKEQELAERARVSENFTNGNPCRMLY